jgi:hypothetical protein
MVESAATFRARWVPRSVSRNRDMWAPPPAESDCGGGGDEAAIAGLRRPPVERGGERAERRILRVRFGFGRTTISNSFFFSFCLNNDTLSRETERGGQVGHRETKPSSICKFKKKSEQKS